MRIGIDARYLNGEYSGIAKYSENIIHATAKIDSNNEYVIYIHPGYRQQLDVPENFKIKTYKARAVSLNTIYDFGRFVNQDNLDLLHSHFPITPFTFDGRTLVTVHDLQPLMDDKFTSQRNFLMKAGYDLFYNTIYPASIRRSKFLISVSQSTRDDIAKFFPAKKEDTLVIHNGLEDTFQFGADETEILETIKKYRLPSKYLLYIGSTRPNKNLPMMIRAFANLVHNQEVSKHEEFKDLSLVMVVNPDRFFQQCKTLLKELNIQERIQIIRKISEEEKKCFYQSALALYFVTKFEGFGFPILEAQAMGCPVITAEHSASPEIAGKGALLVNPDDIEEITKGLDIILTNKKYRQQITKNGYDNINQFNWEKSARRIIEIYENLY